MRFHALHQYRKTAAMVASSAYAEQRYIGLAGNLFIDLLRVLLLIALWRSILTGRGPVGGMTLDAVLTYTLISEVFKGQLSNRTALDGALWEGTIANRFLRPIGIYGQFVAEMVGGWVGPGLLFFTLPLMIGAPFLGIDPLPASLSAGAWFVLSLVLSVAVGVAFDIIFAALMVYFENSVYAMQQMRNAVTVLLSGSLIPLALFPWDLGQYLQWLPFASLASAPLRIYTGTGAPLPLVALQAVWCVVLWPVAHGLWSHTRERLVSHGG
ncbi:ABC transporter permease [Candidatus Latescibacterota bacterium]